VSAGRGLPSSARIVAVDGLAGLLADLRGRLRPRLFGVDAERFHTLARPRRELQRALTALLAEPAVCAFIDDLARALVAHLGWGGAVVIQDAPYTRAVPPRDAHACQPFHVDAYVGHPRSQVGLWFPLVDVSGPEGLFLVDDDVIARA